MLRLVKILYLISFLKIITPVIAMRYIIIFTNLAKFQAKLVYDHIAEKDSPAENCIAICTCTSKNT